MDVARKSRSQTEVRLQLIECITENCAAVEGAASPEDVATAEHMHAALVLLASLRANVARYQRSAMARQIEAGMVDYPDPVICQSTEGSKCT